MKHSMKSYFALLFCMLLTSYYIHAQSTALDERRGFQDFTLGDLYHKWSNDLTLYSIEGNEKLYTYTGSCCQYLFDYKISHINLGFKDEQLKTIGIITNKYAQPDGDFETPKYRDIKNKLNKLFGRSTIAKPFRPYDIINFWEGEEVIMFLFLEYHGIQVEGNIAWPEVRCVLMMHLKDDIEQLQNSF